MAVAAPTALRQRQVAQKEAEANMEQRGQVLLEFNLSLLLILLPLVFGATLWFHLEWSRSKCAYEAFFTARQQLIQTRSTVDYEQHCSSITENIHLEDLESLDQDKGALSLPDLMNEASRLSEDASQLLQLL